MERRIAVESKMRYAKNSRRWRHLCDDLTLRIEFICHLSSILFYFILSNHPVLLFQWFRFNKRISIKSLIEIYLRPPCKKYLRVSSCFEQLYRPRFTSQTTIACEERIFLSILALISFLRAIRICFNALKRV